MHSLLFCHYYRPNICPIGPIFYFNDPYLRDSEPTYGPAVLVIHPRGHVTLTCRPI